MKIPKKYALLLAELHNKVMELQDEFDYFKSECYEQYEDEELIEELESICDQLDTIESETSELDCEYNDYGN